MISSEYKIAYGEVLEILNYIPKSEYDKIPKTKIKMFIKNAGDIKGFKYNPKITLQEQNISEVARTIIAILFRDYWATEQQQQRILEKQNNDRIKLKEKFDSANLFKKKRVIETNIENIQNENTAMVQYKKTFFSDFIRKIKVFLQFGKK